MPGIQGQSLLQIFGRLIRKPVFHGDDGFIVLIPGIELVIRLFLGSRGAAGQPEAKPRDEEKADSFHEGILHQGETPDKRGLPAAGECRGQEEPLSSPERI